MTEPSRRRLDVDIARAFAMFAVVCDHIQQYFNRYLPDALSQPLSAVLHAITCRTSISLFMFAAGIVLAMRERPVRSFGEYWQFVWKKFCRLMVPLVAVSLMTMVIKIVATGWGVADAKNALVDMVIAPRGGPAPHLWFLYSLMSLFLIWPLLRPLAVSRWAPGLLAASFVLAILPIPWPMDGRQHPILGLPDLASMMPFFLFGFWYFRRSPGQKRYSWTAIAVVSCPLIASTLVSAFVVYPEGAWWQTLKHAEWVAGVLAGALFLLWLSDRIAGGPRQVRSFLVEAGLGSYDIYLLHVALVGHPLMLVIGKLNPGAVLLYVLFVAMLVVTFVVPLYIGMAIRCIPPLAFVMLGVPMPRKPGAGVQQKA
jgi:peptidoglycan/LPS O-acetylase OafA/YrhL